MMVEPTEDLVPASDTSVRLYAESGGTLEVRTPFVTQTDLALEKARISTLESLVSQLRTDQDETRRLVESIPGGLHSELAAQTAVILDGVDRKTDELRNWVMQQVITVVRQWPGGAIVAISILATALCTVILHAAGLI